MSKSYVQLPQDNPNYPYIQYRIAFDTEFMWDGRRLVLLSAGFVAVDKGERLYFQLVEPDHMRASEWVQQNVIAMLYNCRSGKTKAQHKGSCNIFDCPWRNRSEARREILNFFGPGGVEAWAYYSHWDWVALNGLFGDMSNKPDTMPMMCYDLRQLLDWTGHAEVKQPDDAPHNAMLDAIWVSQMLHQYDPRNYPQKD